MNARWRAMATIGLHAQLACIWEATARKPGNVHRFKDFEDLQYLDLVASAAAMGEELGQPHGESLGRLVVATREVVSTNTNLGMVLLLAPLAKAAAEGMLRDELPGVLAQTTVADAEEVFRVIRLVNPGGLGRASEQDVQERPTLSLRDVMVLARDRDMIARQYAD